MADQSSERPRTATRLRFVAPPGMFAADDSADGVKTIGRYEIKKTLGKGAMGVVYEARDPLLDRVVAVKTIVSPRSSGKRVRRSYLERFEREAKAAAKMQHPAIVTIFDVGLDEGRPFMVLEYLPGESLADRLDRVRMPLGRAVQIALDLASALGFAHKERIVHRDVKPANVLHAGEARWKLADFGIARMPDSDLTQVGIFMGTPGYAPPEAIGQGHYTPQADVFAWGAVLYELLSGHIPYEGPDTKTTNSYVLKNLAKNPRHWDRSIPEPLADITMTALHKSVDVRYKDGVAAEQALRQAWELCLNTNIISPSALTGSEMPHERVGVTMHSTNPAKMHTQPAEELVIDSASAERFEDDDPTRVMMRPDEMQDDGPTVKAPSPITLEDSIAKAPSLPDTLDSEAGMRAVARPVVAAREETPKPVDPEQAARDADAAARELLGDESSSNLGLWLVVAFATLIAGAFGAYYLMAM